MKITYLSTAQANIVIKTRNEHCEPHVHAYNVQQNWEFKVFFSFISVTAPAIVGKFFKVIAGKPSKKQLEEVVNEVYCNLDRYRSAWWSVVGKVCLSNQYVVLVDGFLREAMPGTRGAVRVHSASFNPSTAEIQFVFLRAEQRERKFPVPQNVRSRRANGTHQDHRRGVRTGAGGK